MTPEEWARLASLLERRQYCLPCRNSVLMEDDSRCDRCLWRTRICGHDCYWLILDMEVQDVSPRTMYDSVSAKDIPLTAKLVAGYLDGRYANIPALLKRFPKATIVTITVLGHAGAHVADCETGDLTPASAARWAKAEVRAGRRPTIYCLESQLATVKRAVALRLPRRRGLVSYWVANYDDVVVLPAGCVAKQYTDPPRSGGHFDLSVVAAHWPGVDPEPAKKAAPAKKTPSRPRPRVVPTIVVTRAWLVDTTERAISTFAQTFAGIFGVQGLVAVAGGHWQNALSVAHTAYGAGAAAALAVVKAAFAAKRRGATMSPASLVAKPPA